MRQVKIGTATVSILVAFVLLPSISSGAPPSQKDPVKYKVIYSFQGGTDGEGPWGLTMDSEGNLYGTTALGGDPTCSQVGCGTVFELKRRANGWTEEILYRFHNKNDGAIPNAGVIFDNAGNIYGRTRGNNDDCHGNVFKLSQAAHGVWTETVLYSGTCNYDYVPESGLVFDAQGNLFGAALDVVFELLPRANGTWKEVTLHTFKGGPDGAGLSSGVVLDSSGNLWGTTVFGGSGTCEYAPSIPGCGVVYQLTPNGDGKWNETVVYNFARGGGRAVTPSNAFRLASNGHFFGTSTAGGDGSGSVFELIQTQKGWEQNVLYRFIGYPEDGEFPLGQLWIDSDGRIYGVTHRGGKAGYGIIFEVTSSRTNERREKILHNFAGSDGAYPYAGVISDSHGHLYGTAEGGSGACGDYGCGVVYEVTP